MSSSDKKNNHKDDDAAVIITDEDDRRKQQHLALFRRIRTKLKYGEPLTPEEEIQQHGFSSILVVNPPRPKLSKKEQRQQKALIQEKIQQGQELTMDEEEFAYEMDLL